MNTILRLLIESTIILSVFYAIYQVFFANDKDFKFSRIYLISSSLLAIIIPQLNIPILSSGQATGLGPVLLHDAVQLPEVIISGSEGGNISSGIDISWTSVLLFIYFTGFSVFLIKFLYETGTLLFFIYRNRDRIEKRSFYKIIYTGGKLPTSSFFQYLFWDDTLELSPHEKEQILFHEEGHIRQLHSVDILYLELLKIIFWFNPFIHSYRKAISAVHEYLADEYVVKKDPDPQYIGLLARQVLQSCHISVSNHFSKSQTVKRIRMMKANRRRSYLFKLSSTIPVVAFLFYLFSCEFNESRPQLTDVPVLPPEWQVITADALPDKISSHPEKILQNYPDAEMVFLKTEVAAQGNPLNSAVEGTPWWVYVSYVPDKNNQDKAKFYAIITRSEIASQLAEEQKATQSKLMETPLPDTDIEGKDIHTKFDEPPQPQGGMKTLSEYIQKNLAYPEEAKSAGIEGQVFIEFVVTKNGEIDNVKIAKGIHETCDQEASRVLRNSPVWEPGKFEGKPVDVKMVLPITFKLDKNEEQ